MLRSNPASEWSDTVIIIIISIIIISSSSRSSSSSSSGSSSGSSNSSSSSSSSSSSNVNIIIIITIIITITTTTNTTTTTTTTTISSSSSSIITADADKIVLTGLPKTTGKRIQIEVSSLLGMKSTLERWIGVISQKGVFWRPIRACTIPRTRFVLHLFDCAQSTHTASAQLRMPGREMWYFHSSGESSPLKQGSAWITPSNFPILTSRIGRMIIKGREPGGASHGFTPSPPTKSFPTKSPWVKLSGRLPIRFNGHENSHPLELRVCLSQTLWKTNS